MLVTFFSQKSNQKSRHLKLLAVRIVPPTAIAKIFEVALNVPVRFATMLHHLRYPRPSKATFLGFCADATFFNGLMSQI